LSAAAKQCGYLVESNTSVDRRGFRKRSSARIGLFTIAVDGHTAGVDM
jgi:hypothetical protein